MGEYANDWGLRIELRVVVGIKRIGRIIYNGAMAVSLLLCLACAGVWVRSGWVSDALRMVRLACRPILLRLEVDPEFPRRGAIGAFGTSSALGVCQRGC